VKAVLAVVLLTSTAVADDGAPPFDATPTDRFSILGIPQSKLTLELEVFSRAEYVARDGDDLSEVRLDRAELGGAVGLGKFATAEVRFEAIRSAAEGGALGIDGDTLVGRVKRGFLRGGYELGPMYVDGALGLAPDPWIATLDDMDTTRPLSRSVSERLLEWSPSDLAAIARVAFGPVRLALSVGNGEGLAYSERNSGKTTMGIIEVVPLATADTRVRIFGMARDGSLGAGNTRDHRFGGGAAADSPYVSGGLEYVHALGAYGRGELTGDAFGAWVEGRPIAHLAIAARGGTFRIADEETGRFVGDRTTFGAGVAVEPWLEGRGRLRIWLAVDRTTSSGTGMPLPTDRGDGTTAMLIVSTMAPYTIAN